MSNDFSFSINSIGFDENYQPADNTRITTNFANLARGEYRRQNLRNALTMIDNRFNALAQWDNPKGDRYSVELEIISVDINIAGVGHSFPTIEVLKTTIVDRLSGQRIAGIVVAVVRCLGLEQPVVREVDAVVVTLAIVDQCRTVSIRVVLKPEIAIGTVRRSQPVGRVIAERLGSG